MVKNVVIDWLSKNEPGNKKLIKWVKSKTFAHEKDYIEARNKRVKKVLEDFVILNIKRSLF